MSTTLRNYMQSLPDTVTTQLASAGTDTPSIIVGPSSGSNPALLLVEQVHGQNDLVITNTNGLPSGVAGVAVLITGGNLFLITAITVTGNLSAQVDASGNLTIVSLGQQGLASLSYMIATVSDVGGPNHCHQLSSAAGSFFNLNMDHSGNWVNTIEADGSIYFGAGSTHASMDVGIQRTGAGVLRVQNGQPNNAFAALEVGNFGANGTTPVGKQSITGALSTVADAAAKAVLTSIITALVNIGLATNNTT